MNKYIWKWTIGGHDATFVQTIEALDLDAAKALAHAYFQYASGWTVSVEPAD